MSRSQEELHRGAEVGLRALHVQLIGMSIQDPQLAELWPAFGPGLSPEEHRKYLYANLIFWHQSLAMTTGDYSEEQVRSSLRFLFTNPLMRGYWMATREQHLRTPETSKERRFVQLAEEIFAESCDPHGPAAATPKQAG
jgi:hypothetical protein